VANEKRSATARTAPNARNNEEPDNRARAKAVFFDLAGTLIEVTGGLGTQYAAVAAEFGVHADPALIDRAFPRAFSAAGRMVFLPPDAAKAASLEKGFWKEVVRGVLAEIGLGDALAVDGTFDRYFERLFRHFENADAWNIFPDVLPAIDRLRGDGLLVGLITNFDYRVFPLVKALGLAPLFASVTVPGVAGAAKPEAAIFEYATARHGLKPSDAVQVGDSLRDDVEGAREAGMAGVLLDRKGRHGHVDGVTRITSLEELPALLETRDPWRD
jgi:putative hydrolase of the HAD superfamily